MIKYRSCFCLINYHLLVENNYFVRLYKYIILFLSKGDRFVDEVILMNIISHSGSARSLCHEALSFFQEEQFEKGQNKLNEAKEELVSAKKAHSELLQQFAAAEKVETNLLLVHAEDHLSSTGVIFELVDYFKSLYIKMEELKK